MLNTDKLIAAIAAAVEARQAGLEIPNEEHKRNYAGFRDEVEFELKTFIEAVVADAFKKATTLK